MQSHTRKPRSYQAGYGQLCARIGHFMCSHNPDQTHKIYVRSHFADYRRACDRMHESVRSHMVADIIKPRIFKVSGVTFWGEFGTDFEAPTERISRFLA
ncbi:unnamed protein product [Rhodiola kirilowii]